jgi:hypothetical protein
LHDFIWTGLDFMKNMSSSGGKGKAHPKLGGKTYLRTNLGEKTSLIPFFFPMYYFDFDF